MIFQDNVIKEYLKNVYFISGTPCGGKTTISRELAKRHNVFVYDIDERFSHHQKISNPTFQPSMNKVFNDADAFFGRTVEEYKEWLIDNTREQLDFVLLDLIRLSQCNTTLKALNEKRYNDIKSSHYFWIERTENSTIGDTVRRVEQHFGFVKRDFNMDTLEIRKVDRDTDLADKLMRFVENFSWEEVKEHMLWVLRTWEFTDWETVFVAMADGQIVGMASIMKADYYPLPEIYPWISSVFVTEEYRGHRISEKLINFANVYAKDTGFTRTYIPSEHIGLYEKYGYRYLKDIVNFGNGTDRLYVKELGR